MIFPSCCSGANCYALRVQNRGYIAIEMRHAVVLPASNVVQQGDHAFLRRVASQLVIHLQYFRFTDELSRRNAQMGRKQLGDFLTTCETHQFRYQTTRLSPE